MGLLWSCSEEEYNPGIQAPAITDIEPSAGFPGQEVVINGRNFSSALAGNQVSFGGTGATIISTTTLAINVVIPEGVPTGSANVTITTNSMM